VASKPRFVVTSIGLTGGGGGVTTGVGEGNDPLYGPPGTGVGVGTGGGAGGKYAALGSHHSWNGPPGDPGAKYAIPLPSGAHVGCATIWELMTV
jgi:hypothetical protein